MHPTTTHFPTFRTFLTFRTSLTSRTFRTSLTSRTSRTFPPTPILARVGTMDAKSSLRQAIRERLQRMDANDRRVESAIIERMLQPFLRKANTVAAYMPYADEPDIRPTLTALLEKGTTVCMPKVDGLAMTMHRIQSLTDVGRNPQTGILEPLHADPVDTQSIDVVLVPGRAFTHHGHRMGRGNGGYDRWLSRARQTDGHFQSIGLCFDCQLVTSLPTDPHDEAVDIVLAPRGTFCRTPIADER